MKQRKLKRKCFSMLLCLAMLFTFMLPVRAGAETVSDLTAEAEIGRIQKYGNVELSLSREEMLSAGYQYGDIVKVKFLDQELDLPFCSNYSDVDSGNPAVFAREKDDFVQLAINMGDFATTYGIAVKTTNEDKTYVWTPAEGVTSPVSITISMAEPGGYLGEYVMHQLTYTYERADYPDLTDEQFANFRAVSTTGIREGILFRTSSPVNPSINRNSYADAALEKAGATVILNLSDDEATMKEYEGAADTYYIKQKICALNMGVDFSAAEFKDKLAEGLKFLSGNKGVYAVHCNEGKDRAGFVSALLECLMGASYDEVVEDYMVSFYNYYGITPDDPKYLSIANSNIVKTLKKAFEVEDLETADLTAEAEEYIRGIGLTDEEINTLKSNLGIEDILSAMDELKGKIKAKKGKIKAKMSCKNPGEVYYDVELVKKKGKTKTYRFEEEEFTIGKLKSGKYKVSITACMTYGNHEYHGETIKKTVKVK